MFVNVLNNARRDCGVFILLSSFTSLGTGRRTQEAEPVQGAYP